MLNKKRLILAGSALAVVLGFSGAGVVNAKGLVGMPFSGGTMPGGLREGQKIGQGISGNITAISGTTITVESGFVIRPSSSTNINKPTTKTYLVDASKATFLKISSPVNSAAKDLPSKNRETTIAIGDFAVGDMIMVKGTVDGTNVNASSVILLSGKDNQIGSRAMGISGTVASVGTTTITVTVNRLGWKNGDDLKSKNETTYTVDASVAKVSKETPPAQNSTDKKPTLADMNLADIKVGDSVRVQGTIDGTNIKATSIIDSALMFKPKMLTAPNINARVDADPQAIELKNTVNTLKPGLWDQIVNLFANLFNKHK